MAIMTSATRTKEIDIPWRAALPLIVFVVLCALTTKLLTNTVNILYWGAGPFFGMAVVVAIALAGYRMTYADVPRCVSLLIRCSLAFAVFYILFSRAQISTAVAAQDPAAALIVDRGWIVALGFGAIGFFRPSFVLLPMSYLIWQKWSLMLLFDLRISLVDLLTLVDTSSCLVIGCLMLPGFKWLQESVPALQRESSPDDGTSRKQLALLEALLLAVVALHFGNYFYGAIGKMGVGANPVHWIYGNHTEYLILASLESGVNPLSFSKGLVGTIYEWFARTYWLFNLATLVGQLVCVVTIIRPRWAMWNTIFYDLMHAGIFVATGIFFWKFILLNLAIVFGLKQLIGRHIPNLFAVTLFALVVLSPELFRITYFFWLDTPSMNSIKILAIDDTGKAYRVPSNYFLGHSVTLVQGRMINPKNGPYPTLTWGTTHSVAEMWAAQKCQLKRIAPGDPANRYFIPREKIERFLRDYHWNVLSQLDESGHINYNFFPHHIFSMPWLFRDFYDLDKRRIRAYRFTLEAVCLGYDGDGFTRKVQWGDSFDVKL